MTRQQPIARNFAAVLSPKSDPIGSEPDWRRPLPLADAIGTQVERPVSGVLTSSRRG